MHLNIFVSQSCFLHCKGCYSFSREEEKGQKIPTNILIDFLQFVYDEGVRKITLCGGDPLTRCDIIALLEKMKEIGFCISMDTVGSAIIKDVAIGKHLIVKQVNAEKIAKLVDMIGIPIDGSTNEIFKRFRQTRADLINEQLAICQELNKYGANICINTVAHKGNLENAYELAKLVKSLVVSEWQIFQYEPLGKFGLMNKDIFEITDKQFSDFQSTVLEVFDNDISKLQFKASHNRKNAYMLIDNSGNAWIPSSENMSTSKFSYILNDNVIIGNITNIDDWHKICSYLDRKFI